MLTSKRYSTTTDSKFQAAMKTAAPALPAWSKAIPASSGATCA
jgi:hypothetical protein